MRTSRCTSCGEQIIWTRTEAGKNMPVNETPSFAGSIILEPVDSRTVNSYVLPKGERSVWPRYQSHFATCPNAKSHRKKK